MSLNTSSNTHVLYLAGSTPSPVTIPLFSPLSEAKSDDEKAMQELKSILALSMEARDKADSERKVTESLHME